MNRHQIEKPCAAKPGRPPRTAIVILGMHRSGTSALARVVNLLGAALPSALLPPAPGNEKGHWEPAKVAALHDEILASVGSQWHAPTGPAEIWFHSPQADAYVARIKDAILSEYGEAPLFVVKDPRLSLLFPLWSRAFAELDIACKAIVAVRNPMEIAQSLCRRESQAHPNDLWHVDRGGLMFLRYILAAERWTRPHERGFVHYDDLLCDWRGAMRRLSAEMNIVWPRWRAEAEAEIDRFLSTSHRHHMEADDLAVHGAFWATWVDPVYSALKNACFGDPVDAALFDRAYLAYDAAGAAFARHFEATAHDFVRQIGALRSSTSWRITAPLRKIAGGLRDWRGAALHASPQPIFRVVSSVPKRGTRRLLRRPIQVSLAALCCAIGMFGSGFAIRDLAGYSNSAPMPVNSARSAAKTAQFGGARWPPRLGFEARRQACPPGLSREVADRAADSSLSPLSALHEPTAVGAQPPRLRAGAWGCGFREWRNARFLLRI